MDLGGDGLIDQSTTSAADGSYTFTGVGPGDHRVSLFRPSAWEATFPLTITHLATALSEQNDLSLHFGNRANSARLAGQVFDDRNNDGIRNGSEVGLDGWVVNVINSDTGAIVATQQTSGRDLNNSGVISAIERGYYEFTLPNGNYEVFTQLPSDWVQTSPRGETSLISFGADYEAPFPGPPGGILPFAGSPRVSSDGGKIHFPLTWVDEDDPFSERAGSAFVTFDRETGQYESLPYSFRLGDYDVSDNGGIVTFQTNESLVSQDSNSCADSFLGEIGIDDIYAWDLDSAELDLASSDASGSPPKTFPALVQCRSRGSREAAISGNGRFIAFSSNAEDLVTKDDNQLSDVFVKDLQTGEINLVSVNSQGDQAFTGNSGGSISISDDGQVIMFSSLASDLVDGDTNGHNDLFIHDRQTGTTERVGLDSNAGFLNAVMSADTRFIAFESEATNLVPNDTNGQRDIFLVDRFTGVVERVSVDSQGNQVDEYSIFPSISADGRFVAFTSASNDLVPNDTNTVSDASGEPVPMNDAFVFDRLTRRTTRVSVDSFGQEVTECPRSGGACGSLGLLINNVEISRDGRSVVFASDGVFHPDDSPELPFAPPNDRDVYLHDLVSSHYVGLAGADIQDLNFGNESHKETLGLDPLTDIVVDEDFPTVAVTLSGLHASGDATTAAVYVTATSSHPSIVPHPTVDHHILETTGQLNISSQPEANGEVTITVTVSDNTGVEFSRSFDVTVNSVNDAPVLDTSGKMALPAIFAEETNNGVLVSDLLASAAPPARIQDADAGASQGIAIVDFDSTVGDWQYSLQKGGPWSNFEDGIGLGNTLLLASDAETRLRLLPRSGFAGSTEIAFRAWDQTSGVNGGSALLLLAGATGGTTAFSTSVETATIAVMDTDGIDDAIEDGAPNRGDGNEDGVPDRLQSHVASLPNASNGSYVTIVASEGTVLKNVQAVTSPDPRTSTGGRNFPVGFLEFEVHGVTPGGTTEVRLLGRDIQDLDKYWKYGQQPKKTKQEFYAFSWDGQTGARNIDGELVLRFRDGDRGDDDLTKNGVIVDPGGPAQQTSSPWRNPTNPLDVNSDGQVTPQDVLIVTNQLNLTGATSLSSDQFQPGRSFFLDVNADGMLAPVDALTIINYLNSAAQQSGEGEAGQGHRSGVHHQANILNPALASPAGHEHAVREVIAEWNSDRNLKTWPQENTGTGDESRTDERADLVPADTGKITRRTIHVVAISRYNWSNFTIKEQQWIHTRSGADR